MPTLYHSLGIGAQSLYATRQGVDTAGHNIANAQVEGYSRQRVNIKQRAPLERHGLLIGNGVYVGSISRAHDSFNEKQLNIAHQDAGAIQARADGLKALELIFSPEQTASISDEMTSFFNSMQDLSNFPEDFTVRTAVLDSGRNLAAAFRHVDASLKEHRNAFDTKIEHKVAEVSDKLKAIADFNVKIRVLETGNNGQQANDLRDQRDLLLRQVSKVIDVNYYEDQHGMLMIRGPKQVTLVEGGHASILSVAHNPENASMNDIMVMDWEQGNVRNITDGIEKGELKGLLDLRDNITTRLMASNNKMAYAFAKSFNAVHRQGFGLKDYAESTGRNFFSEPVDVENAAESISLSDAVSQSHDAISAASSPLAPGDNVMVNQMIKIKDQNLLEGGSATLTQYYANFVGSLGLDVVRAEHVKEASDIMVADLNNRREAVSGVSLDEEAMNLLKWQSNFTASSKVITTVDEMLQTVLSLKR